MKCWVFNEDQLMAALEEWSRTEFRTVIRCASPSCRYDVVSPDMESIKRFLNSATARSHKMTMETKGSPADTLRPAVVPDAPGGSDTGKTS